ncbi:MAG: methyltransferase domain-containing protein, partial [Rhodospirillales bacterium]
HAVCSEVLEHLNDPASVLANAKSFIKPGGRMADVQPLPAGRFAARRAPSVPAIHQPSGIRNQG